MMRFGHVLRLSRLSSDVFKQRYSTSNQPQRKGLVLGVYCENGKDFKLTRAAEHYNQISKGKLVEHIKLSGSKIKAGKTYVFWGLDNTYQSVAVVGLGKENRGFDKIERLDQTKEAIRVAAAGGCNALNALEVKDITLESFGDAETAAEGCTLATWKFQGVKTKKELLPTVSLFSTPESYEVDAWNMGALKAQSQNFARFLTDTPSNLMTPTLFCEHAGRAMKDLNVKVEAHDEKWAQGMGMGSFLSVNNGSEEPSRFLELTYTNSIDQPMVLIGKGVTFDSGGISLKSAGAMDEMRADMGGAACIVATLQAIATMKLPVNIKCLIPLVENMPSGSATKPGDVVKAMNGKTICVENTDAEGRLILADALCYSKKFNPKWVLDIATLTGAIRMALGKAATGVYTNSDHLYKLLEDAGSRTGDRVWRLPLWDHYRKLLTEYDAYDLSNIGKGKGSGCCNAAAFLKEFVPENVDWIHMDIAGVMGPESGLPYLPKGMTGRPTRTLIEFIKAQVLSKQ